MVDDLCLGVRVVGAGTVRAEDGLALSSRNAYLSDAERSGAVALSRALRAGAEAGEQGGSAVLAAARAVLDGEPRLAVDYLALTGPALEDAPESGQARLLVASVVGSTRLIDNVAVRLR
jgi:pantoate--beta-alanine ligase